MIKTLERKGLISRVAGAARTLRVEVSVDMLPDEAARWQPERRGVVVPHRSWVRRR